MIAGLSVYAGNMDKKQIKNSVTKEEKVKMDSVVAALPYKVKLKYADALFEAGNYYDAMNIYLQLMNERPDNNYLLYQLGESNRKARDYETAKKWFVKLIGRNPDEFPLTYYKYAQMLKMNREYEDAKYTFAKFVLRTKDEIYKKRATREIEACDFAMKAFYNPLQYEIRHLDSVINKPYSDYAPQVRDSMLYFSSFNFDTTGKESFMKNGKRLSHLYFTEKEDGSWTKPKVLPEPINNSRFHSGNCAFTKDGKRMYFTQCSDNGESDINCKIYLSNNVKGTWDTPVELSVAVNKEKFSSTHPALGPSEGSFDILYFSSDRPGGKGGFDLWYSEVNQNGIATPPVNLGDEINTDEDEITPFYNGEKLYFSSNGHIGMGGFDIFSSRGKKESWSKTVNMGYPINSSADDMYYVKGHEPKTYYLVSNRPGIVTNKGATCCDDIFMVKDLRIPKFVIKGNIFEKVDSIVTGFLIGAKVEVNELSGENEKPLYENLLASNSDYKYDLKWNKEYVFRIQKKGYFPEIFTINTSIYDESDTIHRDIALAKIAKNKSYKLEKIYYDFGAATLRDDSKNTLRMLYDLLVENPMIVIELSAHTDSVGTSTYNLDLSQRRAQSCVNYLIRLGIKPQRLIAKGYGESYPVAPNSYPDGSDNEEGRQLNRRTEFKIIGELTRVGDQVIFD